MAFFCDALAAFRRAFAADPARVGVLTLLAVCVLVFSGMPAREFTFDNTYIIRDDTRLRDFSWESVRLIVERDYWWPSLASSLYRPLVTFSFWIEYSFLGYETSPFPYQVTNLLLHVALAAMVGLAGRRFGVGPVGAWLAAVIFAVHPISAEIVANIVGRSDILASAAVLGGLLLYLRGLEEIAPDRRMRWFAGCGAVSLAGVLAKESAVALPALVAWHGLCRLGEWRDPGSWRVWWSDAWRAGVCLLPCLALTVVVRWHFSGAMPGLDDHPFIDNPLMAEGFFTSRLTALGVWGMQLVSLFAPFSLSSDYSFNAIPVATLEPLNLTFWWGAGTLGVFLAAAIALVVWGRRAPGAIFLFGAYVLFMLPTSNLLIKIGSIRADRFHYGPSLFFWLGCAVLVRAVVKALRVRQSDVVAELRGPAVALLVTWVLCLGVLAHLRCYDWRSNLTLWQSALDNAPGSAKAMAAVSNEIVRQRNDVASALEALARIERALEPYARLKVDPADWPLALFADYGAFSTALHDHWIKDPFTRDQAREKLAVGLEWLRRGLEYEAAMRRRWAERWTGGDYEATPRHEQLHRNYSVALQRSGDVEGAIKVLDELLERRPFAVEPREYRARYAFSDGRFEAAVCDFLVVLLMAKERDDLVPFVGEGIRKLSPESEPIVRDSQGIERLNLDDRVLQNHLRKAAIIYRELLRRQGDAYGEARLVRSARHLYGIELDGS